MGKIRILHVTGGIMNRGGIANFLMNYHRNIDLSVFSIDYLVHGDSEGFFDKEIRSMGSIIYQVPLKSETVLGNFYSIIKTMKNNNYDIVHCHMEAMSFIPLLIAKYLKVPIRISHSHGTSHLTNNKFKLSLNNGVQKLLPLVTTDFAACSKDAGKWLFPGVKDITIIKNAIDLEVFKYNKKIRDELRSNLKVNNKFVVGAIGSLTFYKNHSFLIDVYLDLKKSKSNAVLIIIGEGPEYSLLEKKIGKLGLEKQILLLGKVNNPSDYLNAMDIFVMPSKFEGLGMAAVEAQSVGLPCVLSTEIPTEAICMSNVISISLDTSLNKWSKTILSLSEDRIYETSEKLTSSGYNIYREVKNLESYYKTILLREG